MKKLLPKIVFQNAPTRRKIETLKMKIAAGEYHIDPQNIAEKLMATGMFFNPRKTDSPARPWLFKPGSF
ncbi:MAG TPA: flagellar biosynthesis anti-sigma factor FlgM [Gammaproteobacteria bacterium]|nr:flagellar biosynthesis anti-sigma factor FlgM [Gammaproteobacteria bacterium]